SNAASIASGSMTRPHSAFTGTTSAPQRSAISINSRPKRPHSPTTTRSPGSTSETIAASRPARPVPDTGNARSFRVWNAKRQSATVRLGEREGELADLARLKAEAHQGLDELHGGGDALDDGRADLPGDLGREVGHAGAAEDDRVGVVLLQSPPALLDDGDARGRALPF